MKYRARAKIIRCLINTQARILSHHAENLQVCIIYSWEKQLRGKNEISTTILPRNVFSTIEIDDLSAREF